MSLVDEVNKGIKIPCPGCKTEIRATMAELHPGNKLTCPGCGATIELKGEDAREIQASLENLDRTRKRFGK